MQIDRCSGSTPVGPSPKGEGRPGYRKVAVTCAATNSLVANHRHRSVPGPLCGCSSPSDMIASYSQPRLAAAFVPATIPANTATSNL